MSLQVAWKKNQEELGQAVKAMREYGLAITNAEEKHDEAKAKELSNSFEKAKNDYADLKGKSQTLEAAISAEREMNSVVNPVFATAPEKHNTNETPKEVHARVQSALKDSFIAYLRGGERSSAYINSVSNEKMASLPSEAHALFGVSGALGGFLVPEDFRSEIVKNLAGYAIIRMAGARVVPTSSSTLVFPSVAGGTNPFSTGVSGAWRAEGSQGTDGSAPATQDQPTFGQERVPIHIWQPAAIVVTRELLADSAVNLDSLIAQLIAETKAMDEDAAFIKGGGVDSPRGLVDYAEATVGPAISVVNSGANGAPQYNQLLDLMFTLPAQYRQSACFLTNSATFSKLLQLKDSSQMPLLYQNALPDTILGKKVYISEQIAAPATGSYSIVFGDMRFYCIAERQDLRVQRLEERFAPNLGLLATARLGGAVLRTQAFVIQKLST
jgi:HK97 family phage major capsid protein